MTDQTPIPAWLPISCRHLLGAIWCDRCGRVVAHDDDPADVLEATLDKHRHGPRYGVSHGLPGRWSL